MKKRLLSILLAVVMTFTLLSGVSLAAENNISDTRSTAPEGAPDYTAYIEVLEPLAGWNEYEDMHGSILFDLDQNGVNELIVAYCAGFSMVFSVFTLENGAIVPIIEAEEMGTMAGASRGHVHIAKKNNELLLAVNPDIGGGFVWKESWKLYKFSGSSASLLETARNESQYGSYNPYDNYEINGTACSEAEYEAWVAELQIAHSIHLLDYKEQTGSVLTFAEMIDYLKGGGIGGVGLFTDIPSDAWYVESLQYAIDNRLMSGVGKARFQPEGTMTRAMLVTVLWRYANSPVEGENKFSDVQPGLWYANAVAWAAHKGIVNGATPTKFNPDGHITREQMATILFRYAQMLGIDTSKRADLINFPDSNQISPYAKEALSWANAEGLINGSSSSSGTYLKPQGDATRAQVAAILMRFIENIAK